MTRKSSSFSKKTEKRVNPVSKIVAIFKTLNRAADIVLTVAGVAVFGLVAIISSIFTTVIVDYGIGGMKITIAPWEIIAAILLTLILINKWTIGFLSRFNARTLCIFALVYGFFVSLTWILIANVDTMWDSRDLVDAAYLLNGTPTVNSASKWSSGGYIEHFPYQTPVVFLIFLCLKLTGSNYLVAYQIMNCLAVGVIMCTLVYISNHYFHNKRTTVISFLLTVMFLPIVFYSTFIYGDLIGFALLLTAWSFYLKYTSAKSNNASRGALYKILFVLFSSLAVVIKSTMIVGVIALIIAYILNRASSDGVIRTFVTVILLLLLPTVLVVPINHYIRERTSVNLSNGVPKIAWITMGIGGGQEYISDTTDDEGARSEVRTPAGYFDGFIWANSGGGYSQDDINSLSKEYLNKRLLHYASDPLLAVRFFLNKIVVQWSEPTYESLLASNWSTSSGSEYIMGRRNHTYLAKSIYYGKLNNVIMIILSALQIILPVGAMIYLLMRLRKGSGNRLNLSSNIPLICIVGFSILYFFWESKTQYMWPVFALMIPMAASGLSLFYAKIMKHSFSKYWRK